MRMGSRFGRNNGIWSGLDINAPSPRISKLDNYSRPRIFTIIIQACGYLVLLPTARQELKFVLITSRVITTIPRPLRLSLRCLVEEECTTNRYS